MTAYPRKALILLDHLFTAELADIAAAPLLADGWQVERAMWPIASIETQRTEIRRLENDGPSESDTFFPLNQTHDFEVIITQFAPISSRAIAYGTNLHLIAINRAGIQNLASDSAAAAGIEVFSVPGRNTNAVAEHTVGLMLARLRFIAHAHSELKKGRWLEEFAAPGPRELAEVQVGIIGYGLIGKRVHNLLKAFGSKIAVFDPYLAASPDGADLVSLETLLSTSDVVTVHVPLNEATRDLISAREIALMKRGSIIVNTARAEIVNQSALREAISNGSLSGAALDVFDSEPIAADDILVLAESTTITPHLAGTTRQAFVQGPIWIAERMEKLCSGS